MADAGLDRFVDALDRDAVISHDLALPGLVYDLFKENVKFYDFDFTSDQFVFILEFVSVGAASDREISYRSKSRPVVIFSFDPFIILHY